MNIDVPKFEQDGLLLVWETGFSIKCSVEAENVRIEANREGLISLARHLLTLAQENVPEFTHIHFDENNSLEDGSSELIIVKKKMQE